VDVCIEVHVFLQLGRKLPRKGARLTTSSSGRMSMSSGRFSVADDAASESDATSVSSYGTEQSGAFALFCTGNELAGLLRWQLGLPMLGLLLR